MTTEFVATDQFVTFRAEVCICTLGRQKNTARNGRAAKNFCAGLERIPGGRAQAFRQKFPVSREAESE